jgi:hypothetical protein
LAILFEFLAKGAIATESAFHWLARFDCIPETTRHVTLNRYHWRILHADLVSITDLPSCSL